MRNGVSERERDSHLSTDIWRTKTFPEHQKCRSHIRYEVSKNFGGILVLFCIDRCTICIIGFADNFYLRVACTITDRVPYFCILTANLNTRICED